MYVIHLAISMGVESGSSVMTVTCIVEIVKIWVEESPAGAVDSRIPIVIVALVIVRVDDSIISIRDTVLINDSIVVGSISLDDAVVVCTTGVDNAVVIGAIGVNDTIIIVVRVDYTIVSI